MTRTRTTRCGLLVLMVALAACVLLLARQASAHQIGLSTGEYTARGSTLVVKMAFARNELAQLAPTLDRNRDGHITASEVTDAKSLLTEKILGRVHVSQLGAACNPALDDAGLTEQDGILLGAHWACGSSDKPFAVELVVLGDLARGHRHVARAISGEVTTDTVLFGEERTFEVPAAPADTPHDGGESRPSTSRPGFGSFLLMGIEHIVTGYDHLVFLFGLMLLPGRPRALFTIITAFTIAHSVTLAVAVLGIWTPSARIVEPAIALSIAYVGVDNLRAGSMEKRWRITFPFGLVHGFGFAGALREVGLAKASIPTALVAFNLGVETGQLAAVAVLLPIVMFLRRQAWFAERGVRVLSLVVIGAGLVWFVARVVSPG